LSLVFRRDYRSRRFAALPALHGKLYLETSFLNQKAACAVDATKAQMHAGADQFRQSPCLAIGRIAPQ